MDAVVSPVCHVVSSLRGTRLWLSFLIVLSHVPLLEVFSVVAHRLKFPFALVATNRLRSNRWFRSYTASDLCYWKESRWLEGLWLQECVHSALYLMRVVSVVLSAGKGLGPKPHAARVSSRYSVSHGPAGVGSSLLLPDLYRYTFSWFLFSIFS